MPKTPTRSVRIGDIWEQAAAKAARQGETMTQVVERLLRDHYLNDVGWPDPQDGRAS